VRHPNFRRAPRPVPVGLAAAAFLVAFAGCGAPRSPLAPASAAAPAAASSADPSRGVDLTTAHLSTEDPPGENGGSEATVRAAYFYDYVSYYHLDSLAASGMNRALVKFISDTLGAKGTERLRGWMGKSDRTRVVVVPAFNLQNRVRLQAAGTTRRYTWGGGTVEAEVACPQDSALLASIFLERAREFLAADGRVRGLLVDLEIYHGGIHHYDRGACQCTSCLAEYAVASASPEPPASMEAFQQERLAGLLAPMLAGLRLDRPHIEFGFLDLDYDSFVHRAFATAVERSQVRAVDYTERTYSVGASGLEAVKAALRDIAPGVPVVGGLWLKRHAPSTLPQTLRDVARQSNGFFLFTTYSLWQDPALLTGTYTLQGTAAEYWQALRASLY
jgi:hypothetical protein